MQRKDTSLDYALDLFLLDCSARSLSPATIAFYRYKLAAFIRFCIDQDVDTLEGITATHVRFFLSDMLARGRTAQYAHNLARAARAWLNFCVAEGLIDKSPFAGGRVRMPKLPRTDPVVFSRQDVQRIIAVCDNERDHAIVLFLLDSGARASELVALDTNDVDMSAGTVSIRQGKGQKSRVTHIGKKTRRQLARYLRLRREMGKALFLRGQ